MNLVLGLALALVVFLAANGLYKVMERRKTTISK